MRGMRNADSANEGMRRWKKSTHAFNLTVCAKTKSWSVLKMINLTQEFVYETDDLNSLKSVLTTLTKVMYKSPKYDHGYTLVHMTSKPKSNNFDNQYIVLEIGDYKSDVQSDDMTFTGYTDKMYDDLSEQAIKALKNADKKKFLEERGDGYNDGFNEFDGIIDVGYRLELDKLVWPRLKLSLVHIYYGK